jgi:hypothetical protein
VNDTVGFAGESVPLAGVVAATAAAETVRRTVMRRTNLRARSFNI